MTSWSFPEWLMLLTGFDTLGTTVIAITLLWLRSVFVTKRAHHDLAERVQGHADRLSRGDGRMALIEQRLAASPSTDAMTHLVVSLERLSGDMKALSMKIEGMDGLHKQLERQVGVMDEFLRQRGVAR